MDAGTSTARADNSGASTSAQTLSQRRAARNTASAGAGGERAAPQPVRRPQRRRLGLIGTLVHAAASTLRLVDRAFDSLASVFFVRDLYRSIRSASFVLLCARRCVLCADIHAGLTCRFAN